MSGRLQSIPKVSFNLSINPFFFLPLCSSTFPLFSAIFSAPRELPVSSSNFAVLLLLLHLSVPVSGSQVSHNDRHEPVHFEEKELLFLSDVLLYLSLFLVLQCRSPPSTVLILISAPSAACANVIGTVEKICIS